MKKLVINHGDDEDKKVYDTFTITPLQLPTGDYGFLLYHDFDIPLAFYTLDSAISKVCEFVL